MIQLYLKITYKYCWWEVENNFFSSLLVQAYTFTSSLVNSLISTFELSSILFSLPCEGLMGTWHPVKVNQPHSLTPRYHYYWYYVLYGKVELQKCLVQIKNILLRDLQKHNWKYYHIWHGHERWIPRFGHWFKVKMLYSPISVISL